MFHSFFDLVFFLVDFFRVFVVGLRSCLGGFIEGRKALLRGIFGGYLNLGFKLGLCIKLN